MPTAYTAGVGDGTVTDLRTFALQCARAMGACIMQRDDPMADLPKLQEPTDYHLKALKKATADLARLQTLTREQAAQEQSAERIAQAEEDEKSRLKRRETESRYRAMLHAVETWKAPKDHAGLQSFMREQLTRSIEFDCSDYAEKREVLTPEMWRATKRQKAVKDIGYHTAKHAKELERVADRNDWITALYESLPTTEAKP